MDLQQRLAEHGCGNVVEFLTIGTDDPLGDIDFAMAADSLDVPVSHIRALYEVESTGSPFLNGRPVILFEPHRFSRATEHQYDASHPNISYRNWDPKRYPSSQVGRLAQLTEAASLDYEAAFASTSYGGFQVLGENYHRCDCVDAMAFAWQESQTVADQLNHFCLFVRSDAVLHRALQRADWVTVAKHYNGTAYYKNRYDVRLAQAQRKAAA
jgi:hypothetical protein